MGLAALSAPLAGAAQQLVENRDAWKYADFQRLVSSPARTKLVVEAVNIEGGRFLTAIKNALDGLQYGFDVPPDQIQVVAALHGPANLLNYDDFIWDKYGIGYWLKVDDPAAGHMATRNPFYRSKEGRNQSYPSQDPSSPDSLYQDTSIQALQSRGVRFLSCHIATMEQAHALVREQHLLQKPEEVMGDMFAHALPGVLVVAGMASAITLLQSEGHYSYIRST